MTLPSGNFRKLRTQCPACNGTGVWSHEERRTTPAPHQRTPIRLQTGKVVYLQDFSTVDSWTVLCPVCSPWKRHARRFVRDDAQSFLHAAGITQAKLEAEGFPSAIAWRLTGGHGLPRHRWELDALCEVLGLQRGAQFRRLIQLIGKRLQ